MTLVFDEVVANFLEPIAIESWEEVGALNDWSGHTARVARSTDFAQDGTNSLKLDGADGNGLAEVYSTPGDGLPEYVQKGDEFRTYFYTTDDVVHQRALFGLADRDNTYFIQLHHSNDQVNLYERSAGANTFLRQITPTLSSSRWYELHVRWCDGTTFDGDNDDIWIAVTDMSTGERVGEFYYNDGTHSANEGVGVRLGVDTAIPSSAYHDYLYEPGNLQKTEDTDPGGSGTLATFEDGDLLEWDYDGNNDEWQRTYVQQATVIDGSWSLRMVGGQTHISHDDWGISTPCKVEWYQQAVGGSTKEAGGMLLKKSAARDTYYVFITEESNNEIQLRYNDGVGVNVLAKTAVTVTAGKTYRMVFTVDDGTLGGANGDLTGELYDPTDGSLLATVTANDTNLLTQDYWGPGVDANSAYYYDSLTLLEGSTTAL